MSNREPPTPISTDAVKQFYDRVYWGDRDRHPDVLAWHTRRLFASLDALRDRDVLDVGCGDGLLLRHLAERGARVAGIDLSDVAVASCRERMPAGEFHVTTADALPFDDGRFDLVASLGTIEHFPDPVGALIEMRRVAKRDATFVYSMPNLDFLTRRLGFFSGTEQFAAIEVPRSIAGWRALLVEAGYDVVDVRRDLHVLTWQWIARGSWPARIVRAAQAAALPLWPLGWQYQLYFICRKATAA